MNKSLRILATMILAFVFIVLALVVTTRLSFGNPLAASKDVTANRKIDDMIDVAIKDGAIMVECIKGQCREIRSGKLIGTSHRDGSYLVYPDTPANRSKAEILGDYVKFITKE